VTAILLDPLGFPSYDATYSYNANGDMTSRTENNMTYTQQWDAEHRLTQVTNTSVTPNRVTKFYYNGDGAWVKKEEQVVGGALTTTLYIGPVEIEITSTGP
jgi:YD repeat-containing protein